MKCLECGKELKQISYNHLKSCCGLTAKQYKEKHPGCEMMDEEIKKKCAKSGEENGNWKGGIKNYCSCGKQIKKESKMCNRCLGLSQRGANNPFYGRRHNKETKAKMSESQQARDPETRYKLPAPDSNVISQCQKKYWSKMTPEERRKRLSNFIQAGQESAPKSIRNTKIEKRVASWLNQNGVTDYKQNITVEGRNVDFKIGDKIIECYGDYWHCNPQKYAPDFYNKSLKMTAEEKWDYDQERLQYLQERGYISLVLWGDEIRNDFGQAANKIKEFLDL